MQKVTLFPLSALILMNRVHAQGKPCPLMVLLDIIRCISYVIHVSLDASVVN